MSEKSIYMKKLSSYIKKFFCHIGIHWMENHHYNFIDRVDGKIVYNAECACGGKWMVDSPFALLGFRVRRYSLTEKKKDNE